MSKSVKTFIAAAIIVCGYFAVFVLSDYLEKRKPALPDGYSDQDLALKGAKLKGFAFGAEGLLADFYWMQALQYLGGKVVESKDNLNLEDLSNLNPRLLYPYLDNATDLDPKFIGVYEYGAVVLPAIDKNQAVKLIEKGIRNNPQEWKLYHYLGYIYWRQKDFSSAAEIYTRGARIENAPPFMRMMAAKMKSAGGSDETAREIYQQIYETAGDKQTREVAQLRLMELDSQDELNAIREALQRFKEKTGRCSISFSEILPLLQTIKLPNGKEFRIDKSNNLVDPTGAPYILDKEKCDVGLDVKTTKIPLK